MGSVYRAQQVHLDRAVAIKVLRRHSAKDPVIVQRFRQEARTLSLLSHPNIVSCYGFGIDKQHCFLVMDLVEGTTLREEVEVRGPLSPERFRHVFAQVLSALQHAHEQGVIHRDLKPDNIMLVSDDTGSDIVKLVDFGIAKTDAAASGTEQGLTKTGAFLGSPLYISPEQCSGHAPDARSDLYSVGCVMYFSCCGKAPFESDNVVEVLRHHLADDPEPLPAAIRGATANLISRAMSKDPQDRFACAEDMSAALQASARSNETRKPRRPRCSNRHVALRPRQKVFLLGTLAASVLLASTATIGWRTHVEPQALRVAIARDTSKLDEKLQTLKDVRQRAEVEKKPFVPRSELVDIAAAALNETLKSQLALAHHYLSQKQPDLAAPIADEMLATFKSYASEVGDWPRLKNDTVADIADFASQLRRTRYSHETALCAALAATSYNRLLANNNFANPEDIRQFEQLQRCIEILAELEPEAMALKFEMGGTGVEIGDPLTGYTTAAVLAREKRNLPLLIKRFADLATDPDIFRADRIYSTLDRARICSIGHASASRLYDINSPDQAGKILHRMMVLGRLGHPDLDRLCPAFCVKAAAAAQKHDIDQGKPRKTREIDNLYEQAIQSAVRLGYSTRQIRVMAANYCLSYGDTAAARAHLIAASKEDPKKPEAAGVASALTEDVFCALAEVDLKENNIASATQNFDKYILLSKQRSLQTGNASFLLNATDRAGQACFAAKKFDAAQKYYRQVLDGARHLAGHESQICAAYSHLAAVAAARGKLVEALRLSDLCLQVASDKGNVPVQEVGAHYRLRAGLHLQNGNARECLNDAQQALKLFGPDPAPGLATAWRNETYLCEGAAASRLKDFVTAETALRNCLDACANEPGYDTMRKMAARELFAVYQKQDNSEAAKKLALEYKL